MTIKSSTPGASPNTPRTFNDRRIATISDLAAAIGILMDGGEDIDLDEATRRASQALMHLCAMGVMLKVGAQ